MVKKLQKSTPSPASPGAAGKKGGPQLSATVKDSAQQIWLAGLGAFAKAQEEGGKVFDALVKEGMTIQRKTQAAAEEKISEATNRMANMATGLTTKATGQWDKLETIFEERVSRALAKLGVPTSKDIDVLVARIEELNKTVQRLNATKAAEGSHPAPPRKRAARKSPAA